MVLLKLVKYYNLSVFEKIIIAFRAQWLLHLLEGVNVFAENDKVVVLVVQCFHSWNNCSNQACFSHLLNMHQLVCIAIFSQGGHPNALCLGKGVSKLLGSGWAHCSTESQYMLPFGKQAGQIAGFEDLAAFLDVEAIAADHLVNFIKNSHCIFYRAHLQKVF